MRAGLALKVAFGRGTMETVMARVIVSGPEHPARVALRVEVVVAVGLTRSVPPVLLTAVPLMLALSALVMAQERSTFAPGVTQYVLAANESIVKGCLTV